MLLLDSLRRCILPTKMLTFYPTLCRSFKKSIYSLFWLLHTHTQIHELCCASYSLSFSLVLFLLFFKFEKQQIKHVWWNMSRIFCIYQCIYKIFHTAFSCRRNLCAYWPFADCKLQHIIYDQMLQNSSHIVKIFN